MKFLISSLDDLVNNQHQISDGELRAVKKLGEEIEYLRRDVVSEIIMLLSPPDDIQFPSKQNIRSARDKARKIQDEIDKSDTLPITSHRRLIFLLARMHEESGKWLNEALSACFYLKKHNVTATSEIVSEKLKAFAKKAGKAIIKLEHVEDAFQKLCAYMEETCPEAFSQLVERTTPDRNELSGLLSIDEIIKILSIYEKLMPCGGPDDARIPELLKQLDVADKQRGGGSLHATAHEDGTVSIYRRTWDGIDRPEYEALINRSSSASVTEYAATIMDVPYRR